MADFFNLVRNENMKIYRRPRTYVMSGVLVGLVLIISLMWLAVGGRDASMWDVAYIESSILFLLVTIFTVIVAAGSVAEEFSTGTIKLLLIRPWSRSKILLSKYIAVVLFAIMQSVLLLVSVWLINWLCFGVMNEGVAIRDLPVQTGAGALGYLLEYYGLTLITSIVTVTMAFMLSTIFRSSALAIGIALFLMLIVNNVAMLLALLKYKWVDYVLFIHLNLTQYMGDFQIREGMSLGFSLAVLAGYYILFMALTWLVFNKRDVSA